MELRVERLDVRLPRHRHYLLHDVGDHVVLHPLRLKELEVVLQDLHLLLNLGQLQVLQEIKQLLYRIVVAYFTDLRLQVIKCRLLKQLRFDVESSFQSIYKYFTLVFKLPKKYLSIQMRVRYRKNTGIK